MIEKSMVFQAAAGTDRVRACVMWRRAKSRDFYKWHAVWSKRAPDMVFHISALDVTGRR